MACGFLKARVESDALPMIDWPRFSTTVLDRGISLQVTEPAGLIVTSAKEGHVEFLNFVLLFVIGILLLRKPEKERLAFRLLVVSVLLMMAMFLVATRTAILPGVNY
jgi:hypothetical protein